MNARVLLLVLITGLFMAAWDGDQAAMHAALAKRAQQRATAIAAMQPTVDAEPAEVTVPSHTLTALKPHESGHSVSGQTVVSLPDGVAAGQYQAVDQYGGIRLLEVSADEATGRNARDFHLVDAPDGTRWYLIRIRKR
jgi:hypothetical protein